MPPPQPTVVTTPLTAASDWPARILGSAPVLLAYLDHERRFRYVNEAHRRWLGIDPQTLLGQRLVDVAGRRNYQRALPALERAYAGYPASFEGELYSDGDCRYGHGKFQPDLDAERHVRGIFTVLVDITERRTVELQLRESEQRFFGAFQHAAIGMALAAPDGQWLRVNAAFCDMLGYPEEALLCRATHDITHADDLTTSQLMHAQMLSGNMQSCQLTKRYLHRDGSAVQVQLSVSLVRDEQNVPRYFVVQIQDLRQHVAFENALHRERQLAEVTLRSIGDAVITTDPHLQITSLNPIAE
ncbi:MAG: PAS domain S-box protein, partial [Rhodanobacter sp.]